MSTKNEIDYRQINQEEIKKYYEDSKIEYVPNKKISVEIFSADIFYLYNNLYLFLLIF